MKRLVPALVALGLATTAAHAQVDVSDPWVRATVPHQKATGAFMRLTAAKDARLVGASSPAAKVVEVHEMKMEGEVMKMRALPALDLPAGTPVELKPGGYHIMLIDLSGQVKEGTAVPLTLVVEARDGTRQNIAVNAPVRPLAAPAAGGQTMMHKAH